MKPAAKILKKVRRGVQTVAYGNPLYQKMLASGEVPGRLHFTLPDLWPGDARAGLALIGSQRSLFESAAPLHPEAALRNLRAVGTDAARQTAVRIIENWLSRHDQWDDIEWAPGAIGKRIAGWAGFYEFYAPAASSAFTARLTSSLQKQYKHLMRTLTSELTGVAGLCAIKGLVFGGLNFEEGEKALGIACDLLKRQLTAEILPDGGCISRCPSTQLHMLRHMIDLRTAFSVAAVETPEAAQTAITAMVPALKFFRHGDGGLALFHGGLQETALLIDAVIMQAGVKSRILRRLTNTGYERLTAGRGLLIADCSRPPPEGYDQAGHAGLLSFEFSHGRERLIVNCGVPDGATPEWRAACAATAAHSTLTVEDTNACEISESDGILCSAQVEAQRFEQDGAHCIEMMHDAYHSLFGLTYQRFLALATDGEELRGRELLTSVSGRNFVLRWHLHPSVQASLTQGGRTTLLRMPSGAGWRLRVGGPGPDMRFAFGLEPSVYCGSGAPRRSVVLKASGRTNEGETIIDWSLAKEKKG